MEIEYCEAQSHDATKLIDYLNLVAGQSDNLTFGKNGCTLNVVQEMQLIQEMHDDPSSVMILAKDGDKIIGSANLSGNRKERLKHRGSIGVSVLKEYWHQGIGSNLIATIIGYAIEANLEILDLEVVTTNENAIALYQKYGFEIIGTYENFMKIDDHYLDVYLMNLYL